MCDRDSRYFVPQFWNDELTFDSLMCCSDWMDVALFKIIVIPDSDEGAWSGISVYV
ncbi:hypothetical protein [Vibrio chagasii]|uniref:hypothetical protein n=1 Tax=Vibrio chagasii TaxID=170679 RepID=UPI00228462E6|nr:hypothetical protein [Vibrio chagasii]MCY9825190.1 hypothetical protein [Vibrio chagasii]